MALPLQDQMKLDPLDRSVCLFCNRERKLREKPGNEKTDRETFTAERRETCVATRDTIKISVPEGFKPREW